MRFWFVVILALFVGMAAVNVIDKGSEKVYRFGKNVYYSVVGYESDYVWQEPDRNDRENIATEQALALIPHILYNHGVETVDGVPLTAQTLDHEIEYTDSGKRKVEVDRWAQVAKWKVPVVAVEKGDTKDSKVTVGGKVLWFRVFVMNPDTYRDLNEQGGWYRHYPLAASFQVAFGYEAHSDKDWELSKVYLKADYGTLISSSDILIRSEGFMGGEVYMDKSTYDSLDWDYYYANLGDDLKAALNYNMRDFRP